MKLRAILREHPDWITDACKVIGTKKEDTRKPPAEAISAVRAIILKEVGAYFIEHTDHLTLIDAPLL